MADAKRDFRDALAARYAREPDQRRIARDAELDEAAIAFDARAINSWDAILREAQARGRAGALVDLVLQEDPNDHQLRSLAVIYARAAGITIGSVRDGGKEVLVLPAEPSGLGDQLDRLQAIANDPVYPAAVRFRTVAAIDDGVVASLLAQPPNIVHVSRSANGRIAFVDSEGRRAIAPPKFLAELLEPARDRIELVVLDGCTDTELVRALAQRLAKVLAIAPGLAADKAIRFAGRLYQAIGFGKELAAALEMSRSQARIFDGADEALLPTLRDAAEPPAPRTRAARTKQTAKAAARTRSKRTAAKGGAEVPWKLWPNGVTLRTRFLDGAPDLRRRVFDAAQEWTRHANIELLLCDRADGELRISFAGDSGSWAYLGPDAVQIATTEPTMTLGTLRAEMSDEEIAAVVRHEFGHVLGLIHETQNPNANIPWDREAVYRFFMAPPNLWDQQMIEFHMLQTYSFPPPLRYRPYDPASIMQYSMPNELTGDRLEIGRNTVLSAWDRAFVAQLYPPDTYAGYLIPGERDQHDAELGLREVHALGVRVISAARYAFNLDAKSPMALSLSGPDGAPDPERESRAATAPAPHIERALSPGRYTLRVRHADALGSGRYKLTMRAA